MYTYLKNDLKTLPPNVTGKNRGIISVEALNISWSKLFKESERARSISRLVIKFIWWGEDEHRAAELKYSTTRNKENKIIYSIQTSRKFFANYLRSCEPVYVKFLTGISNLHIGTCLVKIPDGISKRITSHLTVIGPDLKFEDIVKTKIFNRSNFILGEISFKFEVEFYSSSSSSCSGSVRSTTAIEKLMPVSDTLILNSCSKLSSDASGIDPLISSRLSNLQDDLKTAKTYRDFKRKTSHTNVSNSSRSGKSQNISPHLLNYLSGKPMSLKDEELALQELRSTSPIESFAITDLLSAKEIIPKPVKSNIANKIDSLKLFVKSLTINNAGMRELSVQSLGRLTFTIECKISPNLLDNVRVRADFDIMSFYSDNFDDATRTVFVNGEGLRSVKINCTEFEDDEYIEHGHLFFSIWWREFGFKHSRCFGTTKYKFTNLIQTDELEQVKRLTVLSHIGDVVVGDLVVRVTLGAKGVHFGPDFLTTYPRIPATDKPVMIYSQRSHPYIEYNNENEAPSSSKNSVTEAVSNATQTSPRSCTGSDAKTQSSSCYDRDERQQSETSSNLEACMEHKLLQGLLHVASLRNAAALPNGGEYFLVCLAFWKEDASSTDFYQDNSFNFLEIFPVLNDEKFLNRVRNNHLALELWQKSPLSTEQMVGIVKLPLHQFFIAFRDAKITNHLSQVKLPVISVDGWVTISSPLAGETCGQLQALLAIGTEEQLEYLKASRGLTMQTKIPFEKEHFRIPVPQQNFPKNNKKSCDSGNQTTSFGLLSDTKSTASEENERRDRLHDLLGNFIENLAQRLPPSSHPSTVDVNIQTSPSIDISKSLEPQLRKTSELLDALQKALAEPLPPTAAVPIVSSSAPLNNLPATSSAIQKTGDQETFRISLEIERALNLPRNRNKLCNKKNMKRNSMGAKCKQARFPTDEEPSAYVTFQAEEGYGQMIKSHEGMVYATNVVERSCNPVWNKQFDIAVQSDLLKNDEKRFILKIWRKAVTDLPQCRLLPNPIEDSVIGFSAVDLNVFLAGMPLIAGWFNIIDFNGRINGQVKVNVKTSEDVNRLRDFPVRESHILDTIGDEIPAASAILNVHSENSQLGRAIKRKFTELEEISQRLRARLLDVTGDGAGELDDPAAEDEIDDQFDEFERDLNTECDEDDLQFRAGINDNFEWLTGCIQKEHENDSNKITDSEHTKSDSSQDRIQIIEDCLKNANLDDDDDDKATISSNKNN